MTDNEYNDIKKRIIRKKKLRKFIASLIIIVLLFSASVVSAKIVGKNMGNSKYEKEIQTVDVISKDVPLVGTATAQIGNNGGAPFWSWYGFNYRVAWCACYVSWCENQNGYISQKLAPKFAVTGDGINWFKSKGQWKSNAETPEGGDIIFFDWEGDGICNHVGIVAGAYDDKVYTIEGNSSDMCRIKSYDIDSNVIVGYGYIKYK